MTLALIVISIRSVAPGMLDDRALLFDIRTVVRYAK
jgi:hypothetical protein